MPAAIGRGDGMTSTFNRALDAYLEPPDDEQRICACQCAEDDHDDDGCRGCGDCDGFTEYDEHQAREDYEAERADIAWKERDL